MKQHRFGGRWTDKKLERLRKYLFAYMKIFSQNPGAVHFTTTYVDAFAGTGRRDSDHSSGSNSGLLFNDPDTRQFKKGSARIALEIEPPFDRYVFVDHNAEHVQELMLLKEEFASLADRICIKEEEANEYVRNWCGSTNWMSNRAVVFLDPYGTQVEWATIRGIAKTEAIDLWLLFPLGQAVNRLLTRNGPPPESWAQCLTRLFGTDSWKEAFYRRTEGQDLFDRTDEKLVKDATYAAIGKFFVERLNSIFPGVASHPLALYNSKGVPIYLLCFAAGNPKGAATAVKIADHLLQR